MSQPRSVQGVGFTASLNVAWSNSKRSKLFLNTMEKIIAPRSAFWKFVFFNVASLNIAASNLLLEKSTFVRSAFWKIVFFIIASVRSIPDKFATKKEARDKSVPDISFTSLKSDPLKSDLERFVFSKFAYLKLVSHIDESDIFLSDKSFLSNIVLCRFLSDKE